MKVIISYTVSPGASRKQVPRWWWRRKEVVLLTPISITDRFIRLPQDYWNPIAQSPQNYGRSPSVRSRALKVTLLLVIPHLFPSRDINSQGNIILVQRLWWWCQLPQSMKRRTAWSHHIFNLVAPPTEIMLACTPARIARNYLRAWKTLAAWGLGRTTRIIMKPAVGN